MAKTPDYAINSDAIKAEAPRAIPHQLERLQSLIGDLSDGVDRLENRLQPVITPGSGGPGEDGEAKADELDASRMTNQLWVLANMLEHEMDRIMKLRERVEF